MTTIINKTANIFFTKAVFIFIIKLTPTLAPISAPIPKGTAIIKNIMSTYSLESIHHG